MLMSAEDPKMSESAGIGNVAKNKALTEMAMGYARSRVLSAAARDHRGDSARLIS
jgi:hypothetical protein